MYRLAAPILALRLDGGEPILLPSGTCVVRDQFSTDTRIIEVVMRGSRTSVIVMAPKSSMNREDKPMIQ